MSSIPDIRLKHLLNRFGFGLSAKSRPNWIALPPETWWTKLKDDSAAAPTYLDVADSAVKGLLMGVGAIGTMERDDLEKEQRKEIRQQSREDLKNLNLVWLDEMTLSKAQLREKAAFFWHGHFASRNINILYQQQLLHILREHGLGSFRTLLRAVSKSAAMLAFLNNQQNKKRHPNENFAREVMELFTLGRGHYTEQDIKEAARAFTGWGFRLNGDFVFRKFDHDTGEKTVLGKTGPLAGDDVLDILLEQRQTAYFIARKVYRFFVNEQHLPEERIKWLGDRFYDSDYQIMRLFDDIARSDWFYASENIGANIKSPVELWVGMRRSLSMSLTLPEAQILLQKALGQVLFYPPNVAGWPGGSAWIDSSSLMLRLRLPQMLYAQSEIDLRVKSDDDQQMGQREQQGGGKRRLSAEIDWTPALAPFAQLPESEIVRSTGQYLLQVAPGEPQQAVVAQSVNRNSREQLLKTALLYWMATPEYQMN